MRPLYFVYHIPKTGGQTIRKHLQTHIETSGNLLFLGKGARDRQLTREDIERLMPSELESIAVVCGHPLERSMCDLWPDRPLREVLFAREPAERTVSHFNFRSAVRAKQNMPTQDFAEFFDSQRTNPMLTFVARRLGVARSRDRLSEVIAALSSFWMVGTTQTIDLLSPKLFAALGIADTKPRRANTSGADFPKVLSLTSEITDLVHQRDTGDLALFEACKQMELATLARFGLSPTPDFAPDT